MFLKSQEGSSLVLTDYYLRSVDQRMRANGKGHRRERIFLTQRTHPGRDLVPISKEVVFSTQGLGDNELPCLSLMLSWFPHCMEVCSRYDNSQKGVDTTFPNSLCFDVSKKGNGRRDSHLLVCNKWEIQFSNDVFVSIFSSLITRSIWAETAKSWFKS